MWRSKGNPDPEALIRELKAHHPGKGYSKLDRYRDFRGLFLDDPRGMRVLYEIFSWGNMFRPSGPVSNFNTNETFFHDGERNLALRILAAMNAEPKEKPQRSE